MGYVILQLALSIDGYISRKDHTVDFLEEMNPEVSNNFLAFLDSIETIIMGRKTYEVMLGFGEIPFEDKKIIVCSSKDYKSKFKHVFFSNESIETVVQREKSPIWLFGGATLIQSFLNKNLIDEFVLHYVPHIIGDGIPLFLKSKELHNLTLVSHKQFGNSITITYKK